jgi:hypothetical protein
MNLLSYLAKHLSLMSAGAKMSALQAIGFYHAATLAKDA